MYAFEIRRNLRRIEEIERELGREREARLRDKREVRATPQGWVET